MAPRRTRTSAAAEVQTAGASKLSSPPPTPAPVTTAKRQTRKKTKASSPEIKEESNLDSTDQLITPAASRKRTRAAARPKAEPKASPLVLDELPHNLGTLPSPDTEDVDDQDAEVAPPKKRVKRTPKAKQVKADPQEVEQLAEKAAEIASPDTDTKVDDASPEADSKKAAKKPSKKKNGYGLTPGQSPYPDYPHPTTEECYEVERLLAKVHGKVQAPKTIPLPSLTVTGCGEVPSVLDALIRTRLSAATTGANSARAFQGLVKTFGILQEGIGKGSVDWNAVRLAPQKDVFEAIRSGGLADAKSKDIKAILDMVYEENQARGAALKEEVKTSSSADGPSGSENEPAQEKNAEISRADSNVLSLDHLHLLSNEEAFNKLVQYPGIGPKTASCVLLFCLQRPSFAVDTHVFRLCKYLGWVPNKTQKGQPPVGRETTFSHCEVRIPDDLKYPLHQLFIKHGKTCPRCRAATGQGNERWEEGCPIDHLVKRYGAKKGEILDEEVDDDEEAVTKPKRASKAKKAPKKAKGKGKKVDSESEAESSDLSDPESDDDYDE